MEDLLANSDLAVQPLMLALFEYLRGTRDDGVGSFSRFRTFSVESSSYKLFVFVGRHHLGQIVIFRLRIHRQLYFHVGMDLRGRTGLWLSVEGLGFVQFERRDGQRPLDDEIPLPDGPATFAKTVFKILQRKIAVNDENFQKNFSLIFTFFF